MDRDAPKHAISAIAGRACRSDKGKGFRQVDENRHQAATAMSSLPDDQHMARVSLPEDRWVEFRALARGKKRSIASYLGHLVGKELRRTERVEWKRSLRSRATEPVTVDDETEDEGNPWIPPWEV